MSEQYGSEGIGGNGHVHNGDEWEDEGGEECDEEGSEDDGEDCESEFSDGYYDALDQLEQPMIEAFNWLQDPTHRPQPVYLPPTSDWTLYSSQYPDIDAHQAYAQHLHDHHEWEAGNIMMLNSAPFGPSDSELEAHAYLDLWGIDEEPWSFEFNVPYVTSSQTPVSDMSHAERYEGMDTVVADLELYFLGDGYLDLCFEAQDVGGRGGETVEFWGIRNF